MVNYSIPRAMERIQRLKTEAALPENTKMAKKQEIQKKMKSLDVEVGSILRMIFLMIQQSLYIYMDVASDFHIP